MIMKAYLDNNILVYVENGILKIEDFLSKSGVNYYFSEIHMDELMNGLDNHPELKEKRLRTIEQLCGSNYIEPEVGPFKSGYAEMTPQKAFELSMQFKFLHDHLYNFTKAMRFNRDVILESLVMDKMEVGNYKPSEIFGIINEQMKEHWGYDIEVYLQKQCASNGRTVFSSLFNLLDFVCYRHDKNHAARLYDSSHAYFGQYCDVLVTNDKRMTIKTEAVYSYLGIKSRVLTADEYLEMNITNA